MASGAADWERICSPSGFERLRGLCLPAPELKALVQDRLLDRRARELVGRILIRPDDADRMPGRELARKLAAGDIAREGAQAFLRLGLEYVDAHGSPLFGARHLPAREGRRSVNGRRPCTDLRPRPQAEP